MTHGPRRSPGGFDAVVIGLGATVGAGIFVALGPAAEAAGAGLLPALGIAAVVAYCNATASARLAARHPAPGGAYVYGRERLGPFFGHLAGWAFVVGRTVQAAGLLFSPFAGYTRIAPRGEEVRGPARVRDPARPIPRAAPPALGVALGIALVVYAAVAVAVLAVLGPRVLAAGTVAYAVSRGRREHPPA